MALDSEQFRNVLAIDVDHSNIFEKLAELPHGFPRPHVVMDAYSGRCHAFWFLTSPVLMTDNGHQKPKTLANIAGKLGACALSDGVDKNGRDTANLLPHRALLKSPWGLQACLTGQRLYRQPQAENHELWNSWTVNNRDALMWLTISGTLRTVELREIIDALDPWYGSDIATVKPARRKSNKHHLINGRNDELFYGVSEWCRDAKPVAIKDFHDIYAELEARNARFPSPLPSKEVKGIAKSISGWMTNCYKPSRQDGTRGRDAKLTEGLTVRQRQAQAGKISAEQRQAKSLKSIADAVKMLKDTHQSITQKNVAEISGMSTSTIQKYWSYQNTRDTVASGSGNADVLAYFFSKTIKAISTEQKLVLKAERFYSKLIARLEKKNSKPMRVIREPFGFSRANSDHDTIFELCRHVKALNQDAIRRAENRKKARKSKAKRTLRTLWHTENHRLGKELAHEAFKARISVISKDFDERIEDAERYSDDIANMLALGRKSVIRAEWRAYRDTQPPADPLPAFPRNANGAFDYDAGDNDGVPRYRVLQMAP